MPETNYKKLYKQSKLENLKLKQKLEIASMKQEKTDERMSVQYELIDDLKNKIERLEAQLRKYDNANTPPSKKYPARSTGQPDDAKTKRRRGGQNGHPGRTAKPKPTEFETHKPKECPDCGSEDLEVTGAGQRTITERRKTIETVTTQHTMNTCRCSRCGLEGIVAEAAGVPRQGGYGPGVVSDVAASWESRMPVKMISGNSRRDIGLHLSAGAVSNILRRLGGRLDEPAGAILASLAAAKILHIDETSYRLNGRTVWVWILQNPATGETFFVVRPSRGADVLNSVIPGFRGTIVCDGWRAYSRFRIQRCWAHIMRELKYVVKLNPDDGEAARMLKRLRWIYKDAKRRRPKRDRQRDHGLLAARTRRLVDRYWGKDICQPFLVKLKNALPDLFRFVLNPRIPPTNNAAERGLREIIVHRKIRGQMKSDDTPAVMGSIFTCFTTWKNRGLDHLAEMAKYL